MFGALKSLTWTSIFFFLIDLISNASRLERPLTSDPDLAIAVSAELTGTLEVDVSLPTAIKCELCM